MGALQQMMMGASAGGGGASDPNYASVSSLLHFDSGTTTITDQKGIVWTAAGVATSSTTQSKFGGASADLAVSSGGVGTQIVSAADAAFTFGTGDFTVEYWLYQDPSLLGGQARVHFDQRPLANGNYLTIFQTGGATTLTVFVNSANRIVTASGVLSTNTWQHIAYTRTASTGRLFVGGTQVGSWADTINYAGTVNRLGQTSASNAVDNKLRGYMDDLRITKGVARYTANFSPPTAAFPNF